nr:EOG090X06E3 [Sida crystallina]
MSFTCMSCHVAFKEAAIQRDHYKTDWHRYNLKRKVVDLPPVTAEAFQERVLEQRAQAVKQQSSHSFSTYCQFCRKKFGSQKSYENHLQSKKHQDNVLLKPAKEEKEPKAEKKEVMLSSDDEEMEEGDSEDWEDEEDAIPITSCLFCKHQSPNMEDSVKHMSDMHSFFIPDFEYVSDVEGLLTYVGERIGQGHICLWCGHLGRQFPSTEAVQKHMIDKGHCKMFHEGEVLLEYSDFYDFSTSYPDQGEGDEEVEENILNDSGFELVLPSGATIGHRSLYRYYRQKLNPVARPASRSAIQHGNYFKAIGWNSSSSREVVERKVRDMRFMKKVLARRQLHVSINANRINMKHFRRQVDF